MDWDLQAIVGCTIAPATTMDNPNLILSQGFCAEQDELLCDFQKFSETKTVLNELEGIYKPLYPMFITTLIPSFHVPNLSLIKMSKNSNYQTK